VTDQGARTRRLTGREVRTWEHIGDAGTVFFALSSTASMHLPRTLLALRHDDLMTGAAGHLRPKPRRHDAEWDAELTGLLRRVVDKVGPSLGLLTEADRRVAVEVWMNCWPPRLADSVLIWDWNNVFAGTYDGLAARRRRSEIPYETGPDRPAFDRQLVDALQVLSDAADLPELEPLVLDFGSLSAAHLLTPVTDPRLDDFEPEVRSLAAPGCALELVADLLDLGLSDEERFGFANYAHEVAVSVGWAMDLLGLTPAHRLDEQVPSPLHHLGETPTLAPKPFLDLDVTL
jgi:hypothetical protein